MGNTESDPRGQSESDEDDSYDFHKRVLKEGAKPVKAPRISGQLRSGSSVGQDQLPDTPESLPDEFADAREHGDEDEDEGSDRSVSNSGSGESGTSVTGSSRSLNSSCSASDRSVSEQSGESHDQSISSQNQSATSHDESTSSHNKSSASRDESASSLEKSSESISSPDEPKKLPNRIRVIDTESEGEEEMETSATPASGDHSKKLLKPVPVHPAMPSCSTADNGSILNSPIKRKADDMLEESPVMAVNVKKNGGPNRPFARKRQLKDVVFKHVPPSQENMKQEGTSSSKNEEKVSPKTETLETSASSTKSAGRTGSSTKTTDQLCAHSNLKTTNSEIEAGNRTGDTSVPSKINPQGPGTGKDQNKFEHSNMSPFKNFHLQPSSSTAGADISETAEAPRERPGNVEPSIPNVQAGKKRPLVDPGPSTSSSETSRFDMFERPSSIQHSVPTVPVRGNSGQSARRTTGNTVLERSPSPRTSHSPNIHAAAAENKFEDPTSSRVSPGLSDWKKTDLGNRGDKFSFLLGDNLNVHICYDSIIALRTDALVNPTDGQLTHVNEIARQIAMATGTQMTNQCQFFLRQNGGPLEVTEVTETYACGTLSGRVGHVIHLAAPVYEVANEKDSNRKLLQSYLNSLTHINDTLALASVVFPCIGAGTYPQDSCINIFFEALLIHLAQRKLSIIKTVKFVLTDVHSANLAIAMIQAHLERIIMEGIDVVTAEALNSYYGNSEWERHQNDINDQLGRQLEVDSPKKLFRGPPVKRPRL